MADSKKLWNIETPSEELARLERELIEMELAYGVDIHAVEPVTQEELREQAIVDFNQPEYKFDDPEWFGYDDSEVDPPTDEDVTRH